MAYKMKGPSMYPNYGKAKEAIKLNREDTSRADGRATSSPFQMHDGKKHKVDPDAPGTPGKPGYEPPVKRSDLDAKGKAIWDKNNKKERPQPTYEGTDEYREEKDIPKKEFVKKGVDKTYQDKKEALIKKGFTPADADKMIKDGATN